MVNVLCVQVRKDAAPSLPVSSLISGHCSFLNLKGQLHNKKQTARWAAGWQRLPGRAPRREKGFRRAGRGERAQLLPSGLRRAEASSGKPAWAGPGRAGPCLQLPLHSGGSYKLRRLAPRTRRPAPRTTSHRNPAPLLRRAGLCPSPGAYLAKGRTATKAAFLFFFF